jgi:beta-phosphoglucomutase-like phosphatase (HAD superfamily)
MFRRFKEKYSTTYSVMELVDQFQKEYLKAIAELKDEKPINGVDLLIKELHRNGVKLAVASSAKRKKIEMVLKMFELESYFDVIVSGYEVENSKPAPDIT